MDSSSDVAEATGTRPRDELAREIARYNFTEGTGGDEIPVGFFRSADEIAIAESMTLEEHLLASQLLMEELAAQPEVSRRVAVAATGLARRFAIRVRQLVRTNPRTCAWRQPVRTGARRRESRGRNRARSPGRPSDDPSPPDLAAASLGGAQ